MVGAFRWHVDDDLFGGFSALEISAKGDSFTALTDKGSYVTGQIFRDVDGRITAVKNGTMWRLKSNVNEPLKLDRNDSEGLAIAPDGTAYVSFEGIARVLRYDRIDGLAENLPRPKSFDRFPRNASLEALAVDQKGALYTFPEELTGSKRVRLFTGQPGNPNGPDFPVWRYSGGQWSQPFVLPRLGNYLPVGADFGPDGRLYVLERQFRGIAGFGNRVRSFVVGRRVLSDERTEMESPIGMHDNLEGLSVWRDAKGRIRLTMISDNNFLPIQRTEIVEYRVAD
ncbi:esterase-like activity of phytase family protein [Thioclava sp. FR2]|uniref:esterase-like activity of phytase family protein n=1 Tax=Thioclava sp. FR2 TaxID=3445780 RepID=UPI003EBFB6BB